MIEKIKSGKIDCNNQSSFISILIKGLMIKLNEEIKIRDVLIPHIIIGTGDEIMYLENKGQDNRIEPLSISNENYTYNTMPRCMVSPKGLDIISDQLSNPYSRGVFEIQDEDNIYSINAEFRRVPIKLSVDLTYYTDSFTDMLELMQQIITKLYAIRTYDITYMGQRLNCSYKIPETLDNEYSIDLDGITQDNRSRKLSLSLEVESNIPVIDNKTVAYAGTIITNLKRQDIHTAYNITIKE